ncbi:DUF3592 domain-containing protein [Flavilitoribacter nigricans]|uniref:DUF3592 domain-containing protein n=1 Tax=Flavilitoribacter nigricans (strain ATCC 23147 / DSM 23189 / NBRC 102662 / NCIMB 1420 / SS-2) TaxID=1122177 RepID=A0A2D0NEG7_FLAN2|nr:DUF3592 domain-containing protein [Flavilitoribacter nigricans]PHN06579.1 hypothetical protein CRP01_09750 [Flavilitoribacter nigricans DSM 23189 = NBRC 102662]
MIILLLTVSGKQAKQLADLIILLLLAGFLVYGEPLLYSKSPVWRWIPLLLVFIALPVLLYRTLKWLSQRTDIAAIIALGAPLLLGPAFGLIMESRSERDLLRHGITTPGTVVEHWRDHSKGSAGWLLVCTFSADGRIYRTFSEADPANRYAVGDTLRVLYSARNPENSKILELNPALEAKLSD